MTTHLESLLDEPDVDWLEVLDTAILDFGGATGTLHRLDEEGQQLHLVAQRGIPVSLIARVQVIPVGKGIAGVAAARRQPVELCNLQRDLGGVAEPGARATNVQGSLAVPCLDGDRVCGTLGVGLLIPHDFTRPEMERLMAFGRQVARRL